MVNIQDLSLAFDKQVLFEHLNLTLLPNEWVSLLGCSGVGKSTLLRLIAGQKQRVALARVLMQNADLVLLDEPFSALDAISRYQLQNLAHELLKNKSVLLVTHDPQEALRLSQRIFVLRSPQPNQPALSDVIKPEGKAPRELNQENLWMLQQQLLNELLEGKR